MKLYITLLLMIACVSHAIQDNDVAPMVLVEHNDVCNTYFFRGPEYINDTTFDYDSFVSELRSTAKKAGVDFPDEFYVVDLCLLQNRSQDLQMIAFERDFFASHPNLGEWHWWISNGAVDQPYVHKPDDLKQMIMNWDDKVTWVDAELPNRVEQIWSWMHIKYDVPRVIYAHCQHGIDRTGEMCGSFYQRYMGMSLKAATALNEAIARPIDTCNQDALDYYCFYLKYRLEGFESLDCSNPK